MKKLFLYVFLGLLLGSNAFAATVEDFKCTPKETSQKEQAKKDFNFKLISTQSEKQKFVTYNNKENVAMAWIYNEELLKQKMKITGYKSYTEWTTYEFNDYFPEEYTVTNYTMTERKKDGRLLLAGSVVMTSEYYHKEFSELEKLRNEHKNNEEKYFTMFKKDTSRIYEHFGQRWNSQAKSAKIAWDCNKQSSPSDSQSISIDPDDINYKKTILNNKIVGAFKDIANHEWIFKDDGTRLYDIYLISSLENIGSYKDCWLPTKDYRILEYKECDSNEIKGTMKFDFVNMILTIDTRHNEHLIFKLIKPIEIIYK